MAKTCTSLQKSVEWCEGTPSYPGIKRKVYFIAKSQIVKFPTMPMDEFGNPTSSILTGDFVLAAEKKWLVLDVVPGKSGIDSEPQGESPSQMQLNKFEGFHNGAGAVATDATFNFNNTDCVYLIQEMDGSFRVLGNENWVTKSTVSQTSGKAPGDQKGTTFTAECFDVCPAPFYKGKIETEDGDFMADGSAIK